MGTAKSGKTSIKKVVFEKMPPHESVLNETTIQIDPLQVESMGYAKICVTEFYTNFYQAKAAIADQINQFFSTCGMIIYVFDSQDGTSAPFDYFRDNVLPLLQKYPKTSLAIFTHKTDSVNINKNDLSKQKGEIQTRFKDILNKANTEISVSFYSTSIYDYSLFETFSKIFQKMMPQNNLLSNLLDSLTMNCKFEKSYLFDVFNKIYLAVDSSPMENQTYEICSDMIDVVLDMSGIYGEENGGESYFDANSMSLIKISNCWKSDGDKSALYLRFIDSNLALIAIISEENYDKPHLLNYNIEMFRNTVKKVLGKN
jgi:Ras-related GTP-binding protein C/D